MRRDASALDENAPATSSASPSKAAARRYTTIAVYMAHVGMERLTQWPYTVNPIAAIAAPFFLGFVADRFFATQKVLGVLHLLGGVIMLAVPRATGNPGLFIGLLLLYNLCFMPTLGLTSSLSFYVFVLCAFLICIPLAAYYNFTQLYLVSLRVEKIAAVQTLGQMSEFGFMLLMPLMFRRLGVKAMLSIGMAAWVVRYGLF